MGHVEKKRLNEICETLQELARMARAQKKWLFYAHLVDAKALLEASYEQSQQASETRKREI